MQPEMILETRTGDIPMTWRSKLQSQLVISTTVAEYAGTIEAVKETILFENLVFKQ